MNLALPPLHVTVDRLPRLRTDQTASVIREGPAFPGGLPAAIRAGDAVVAAAEGGTTRPGARSRPPADPLNIRFGRYSANAFQFARVPVRVSPCDPAWVLSARPRFPPGGDPLAYSGVAGVLRLVAAAQHSHHRALNHHQLRLGVDPVAAEPAGRFAASVAGDAADRHPVQCRLSRLLQICRLRLRHDQ